MLRAAALAVICISAIASAQEPPPILHEYVPGPKGGSRVVGAPTGAPNGDQPPANPTAIRSNGKVLVQPPVTEPAADDEITHGSKDFGADRDTELRPDYLTQQDGTLHYAEVYNPSVVPFKRMSVLDSVRPDYTLYTRDRVPQGVPIGGQAAPDRDLFWGSLVVDFAGDDIPIPSVAPDMRILSVESEPPVKVVFGRDSADNFYVRAVGKDGFGRHRLVFLVDAAATYFAPQVPTGYALADLAALHPVSALPPRAQKAAAQLLGKLHLTDRTPYDEGLARLVEYFRGFEAGAPPSASGDVYLDLALSRRGVCRHRAFAFMVTALAAGIPTRFVSNEAHAWTEVWAPDHGWLRIDLGGAALELDVANASDKSIYRPRGKDPFPKPRSYADNYTRLRGNVGGIPQDQLAEARAAENAPPGANDPGSTDPVAPGPGAHLPHAAPMAGRRDLAMTVETVDREGFRGEAVRISGHARDGGHGVEGLLVDVYLAPAGKNGDGARLLGQSVTKGSGEFTISVELPLDLPLGSEEVYAATPGNGQYAASVSN